MKSNNKIKKKVSNNITYLEIKGEKNQQLDAHKVEAITKNKVEGLLPLQVQNAGKTFKLIYNITGLQSLKGYLSEITLNKQLFGFLLQNIFNIINILDQNYFDQESLMLTFSKVKIEPASKRLYFMYIPIQNYDCDTNLKEFLQGLISIAHFSDNEDNSYVKEYISILNNGVNFSKFDLQEYINSIANNGMNREKAKKCPNCGNHISVDANYCPGCNYSFIKGGVSGITRKSFYNPAEETTVNQEDLNSESEDEKLEWGFVEEKSIPSNEDRYNGGTSVIGDLFSADDNNPYITPQIEDIDLKHFDQNGSTDEEQVIAPPIKESELIEYNTTEEPVDISFEESITLSEESAERKDIVNEDSATEAGTTVLDAVINDEPPTNVVESTKKIIKTGYLTRLSNNEKRKIDKDIFSVGRSLRNDFSVPDNGAVGRSHIIFRVVDNKYYIVDQNSKNKTYVNSKVIPPATNIEVFDKTRIKLANEDFVFNIVVMEV